MIPQAIRLILNNFYVLISLIGVQTIFKVRTQSRDGQQLNAYHVKKYVYTRLGLKAYIFNNNTKPKNNFFIGGFINANLFQADFSEISLGFVRRLN